MIIIDKHSGQLCNRLWSLLPTISYAIKNNENVIILWSPSDIERYFPNISRSKNISFIMSGGRRPNFMWRFDNINFVRNRYINCKLEHFVDTKINKIKFIDAWAHSSDKSYLDINRIQLLSLFQPRDEIMNKLNTYFNIDYKGITVGVHIRRGDYKDYLSGKYYFSIEKWSRYIAHLYSQIKDHNVSFLICSNEEGIEKELSKLIPDINLFTIPDTNGITDLYALAKCEYIIGVPSSYSQWASFIGEVPLYIITDDKMPSFENFHKIIYFNHFDDGSTLEFENENYYIKTSHKV